MIVYAGFFLDTLKEYANSEAFIIVDTLRFSTTVSYALKNIKRIYFSPDINEAIDISRKRKIPLIAEVDGYRPIEADYDNSPSKMKEINAEEAVIRTTSGVYLLDYAIKLGLKNVFIGAIVNAKYIADFAKKFSTITIAMAGYRRKKIALDDLLGAGAIISELGNARLETDEAIIALELFKNSKENLFEKLKISNAGKFLVSTGRENDVKIASMLNSIDTVPKLEKEFLINVSKI